MNKTVISYSEAETEAIGAGLAEKKPQVVALFGDLGAGKTVIVRGLARALGYTGRVTSPTFAIVNEYLKDGAPVLYHFDMYRITSDELADLGWDDYLASGVICAVEWAEAAEAELPQGTLRVRLSGSGTGPRTVEISEA